MAGRSNALRGQYKLARVISVKLDEKGIVRDISFGHCRLFVRLCMNCYMFVSSLTFDVPCMCSMYMFN